MNITGSLDTSTASSKQPAAATIHRHLIVANYLWKETTTVSFLVNSLSSRHICRSFIFNFITWFGPSRALPPPPLPMPLMNENGNFSFYFSLIKNANFFLSLFRLFIFHLLPHKITFANDDDDIFDFLHILRLNFVGDTNKRFYGPNRRRDEKRMKCTKISHKKSYQ